MCNDKHDHIPFHNKTLNALQCATCDLVLVQFAEPPDEDEQRRYRNDDMLHDAYLDDRPPRRPWK